MYELKPSRVYVHRRVYRKALARARLERMLAALGNPAVDVVDERDTDRILEESGPPADLPITTHGVSQGVERRRADPAMLFNTFEWDPAQCSPLTKRYPSVWHGRIAKLMLGAGEEFAWSPRAPDFGTKNRAIVCEGGWGIHTIAGCVHKCDYCAEGYIVNIMLDLEEFADHLTRLFTRRPEQKLYRYDVMSDTICFEPEYGASAILADCFARSGDKHLLYYTKSDNVDHLLGLPTRNAIFYCTLSTDSVCRLIERDTPSLRRRIDGLRRCQEAGYRVRVGFSPIVPVTTWREEATQALEDLFAAVSPQVVRLWVISLMKCADFERCIDPNLIDPSFLSAMRSAAPELDSQLMVQRPFPRHVRREIYGHYLDELQRISPDTLVGLCSEERAVWEALQHKLRMTPEDPFCCCGGCSVVSPKPNV